MEDSYSLTILSIYFFRVCQNYEDPAKHYLNCEASGVGSVFSFLKNALNSDIKQND